jgi:hypothetical protein
MGRELDNYHGLYRYFVADYGDLDYYFIAGETLGDIVRRYTWLTGHPAFTTKWGLGYSGSTMTYTDSPNAQERMNEFLMGCEKHDILCDSFYLSSGYTSIDEKCYVFNWNLTKFRTRPSPPLRRNRFNRRLQLPRERPHRKLTTAPLFGNHSGRCRYTTVIHHPKLVGNNAASQRTPDERKKFMTNNAHKVRGDDRTGKRQTRHQIFARTLRAFRELTRRGNPLRIH